MRNPVPTCALAVLALTISPAAARAAAPSFAPFTAFATGSQYGPGFAPVSTVGADFDGDGDVDVATASNFGQADARLLRNTGTGTFGPPIVIPGTSGAQSLAAGDVDGDGDADLVGMTSQAAVIARNDGTGACTITQTLPLTIGAQVQAILTDTDADGDLDVAAPTFNAIQTLRNAGDGTFAAGPSTTVPGAFGLAAITAADLDGDGVRDLLAADGGSGVVHALLGTRTGSFDVGGSLAGAGLGLEDVAAVDLDGDGIDDVAAVGSFSFSLGTGLSDGRGGFKSPVASVGPGGSGPTSVGVGDVNRDGRDDLLVSFLASPNGGVRAFTGNGTVTPTAAGTFATGRAPQNPVVSDLDGDGRLDAALAGPGSLFVLRNTTP